MKYSVLLYLLETIESNNNENVKDGDNGKAVGILQIWPCVIEDVNRVYKTKYILEDRRSKKKSEEICIKYLIYWIRNSEKVLKRKATVEDYCRCWNGGPNYYKKLSKTEEYWQKCKQIIEQKGLNFNE